MSINDIHENNTIYLMHTVSNAYARAHQLTRREFSAADDRFCILAYISKCPSVFDALPESEMVKEVDDYVRRCELHQCEPVC